MDICPWLTLWSRFATGRAHGIESVDTLAEGVNLTVGNKELEVDHVISREEFLSGRCFQNGRTGCSSPVSGPSISGAVTKPYAPLRPKTINDFKPPTRVADPAPPRKEIELEPVDLVKDQKLSSKIKTQDASWTANW